MRMVWHCQKSARARCQFEQHDVIASPATASTVHQQLTPLAALAEHELIC